MRARRDFRWNRFSGGLVVIEMTAAEFREEVEWRRTTDPDDGATREWEALEAALFPPEPDDPDH